jgi:hypothetical protein
MFIIWQVIDRCDTNELLDVQEGCVYVTLGMCDKLVWDDKK